MMDHLDEMHEQSGPAWEAWLAREQAALTKLKREHKAKADAG